MATNAALMANKEQESNKLIEIYSRRIQEKLKETNDTKKIELEKGVGCLLDNTKKKPRRKRLWRK